MGETPHRSAHAGTGGTSVTSGHDRLAGASARVAETSVNGGRTPGGDGLGGGGALPRARAFGAERAFRGLTLAAGTAVLVIIAAIAIFLIAKAVPALQANSENFWTFEGWFPNENPPTFGIGALAFGTVLTALLALLMAVPVALGIALYLSHYAPRRLGNGLGFLIDLLAAVPSVVFGLWGRDYLVGPISDLSAWLNKYFSWIPIFGGDGPFGNSILLGSVVLAIMVLPIITSLSREVFLQTPTANEEAALALGATRWEMLRTAVLPYGRPGIIAAVMLGLGRALGETIALALTLGSTYAISFNILESGGNTIAANIANRFAEANDTGRGALIASGLVLFAITLIVNITARAIIYRRREFTESAA
ncbi:phosphate ABC transporter permease subunit PstC [Micromonospora purpureochromogenes]|uniref:phosphate ABC transporter permease subunit PstC n=1 Tax=Micromonospora purpureochromogenes TaxID=47872 RepID=UPI0033F79ABE